MEIALINQYRDGQKLVSCPLDFLSNIPLQNDIAKFKVGLTEFTLVNDPVWIKRILMNEGDQFGHGKWKKRVKNVFGDCLFTREGCPHQERKNILKPYYSLEQINNQSTTMATIVDELVNNWEVGEHIDIEKQISKIIFNVVGCVLFDKPITIYDDKIIDSLHIINQLKPRLPIPFPKLVKAKKTIKEVAKSELPYRALKLALINAGIKESDVNNELIAQMAASVDSTVKAFPKLSLCLCLFPNEKNSIIQEFSKLKTDSDINSIPMKGTFNQFLSEVLRLFPPVQFIDRRAKVNIDMNGTQVNVDDYILISPLLTHRKKDLFNQPDHFRKERWKSGHNFNSSKSLSYFPFGAGQHACMGSLIARKTMAYTLKKIFDNGWDFQLYNNNISMPKPHEKNPRMKLVEQKIQ